MPIRFNPSGTLDIGTDPADLPIQSDGKMAVSGAMTRCTNLSLDRAGIASTRKGSAKLNPDYDYAYSHSWETEYISGDVVNPFSYDNNWSISYLFSWELNTAVETDDPGVYSLTYGPVDRDEPWGLFEQEGYRYLFSKDALYRSEELIEDGLAEANWSGIQYNAYNSDELSLFVLNGTDRKRITGTTVAEWGSDSPTAAAVIRVGKLTGLTGAYNVKYTWARKEGAAVVWESNPSAAAATAVTLSNGSLQIYVDVPTDEQITHIRVYRTAAGGTTYLHDQDIEINWSTYDYTYMYDWEVDYVAGTVYQTFTEYSWGIRMFSWEEDTTVATNDYTVVSSNPWESNLLLDTNTADTAIGTEASWVNHDRPPLGTVALGPNFSGYCFILNDNNLHYCLANQPEYWPSAYYIEVSSTQFDLLAGAFLDGVLYVATINDLYQISGSGHGTFLPLSMSAQSGTVNARCFVAVKGIGIYHLGADGIYLYSGGKDQLVSRGNLDKIFQGNDVGNIPGLNRTYISNCWMLAYHGKLYIGYPGGTSEFVDNVFVLDLQNQKLVHHSYSGTFRQVAIDNTNSRLLAADIEGYVWEWEDSDLTDDAGTPISWQVQSADFNQLRKYFPRYARYDVAIGTGGSAAGYILLDGAIKQTHTLNGDRLTRKRLVDGCTGDRLAVRISGSGSVSIYGAEVE